ncbi:MAG: leucine-rich repeat protein [Ruminococcus sp.]|nr:leucine-rich repeat protein [Ruminococcus sp.]
MNKLKKMAVVVTAMVTMGSIANMPISQDKMADTAMTSTASYQYSDLAFYQYGDWWYSIFSDGTVVIRQYDGDDEVVTVPSQINGRTVVELGDNALQGSTKPPDQKKEIILPETIRKIGACSIAHCAKLEKINIPKNLKEIGGRAFIGCSSLKSININNIEKLGWGAFESCESLEEIYVPGAIKTIYQRTFDKCTNLKVLTIGEGVTTIEKEAAINALALEKIVIPDSVTSIGEYAFCYSCEFHEVNKGSYVGYYQYTLNADNLKEYDFVPGSAAEQYGIENGILEVFEHKIEVETPLGGMISQFPTEFPTTSKGDINSSGAVDASDASVVLAEYSAVQTGGNSTFSRIQKSLADVNNDGVIDASDASKILAYYSAVSTGKAPSWD